MIKEFKLESIFKKDSYKMLGKESFALLEDYLHTEQKLGNMIVVDVKNVIMNDKLTVELARLKAVYNCEFINLDDREDVLNAYIDTYYFIKKTLGIEEYGRWLVKRIKDADFPLMIYDNRLNSRLLTSTMDIIAPVGISRGSKLKYMKLKSYYTEPKNLVEALNNNKRDIWENNEIAITDLWLAETGIRFPSNETEATMVLMIKNIIEKGHLEDKEGRIIV